MMYDPFATPIQEIASPGLPFVATPAATASCRSSSSRSTDILGRLKMGGVNFALKSASSRSLENSASIVRRRWAYSHNKSWAVASLTDSGTLPGGQVGYLSL